MVSRWIIVAALGVITACSGAQSGLQRRQNAPTAREYFPLRLHSAWAFNSTDLDHGSSAGLVTLRVVRSDGAGGFYVQHGAGMTPPAMYSYTADSVMRDGEVILRQPIRAGERWSGHSGDGYVIRNVGLVRTVPAGTYHNVVEVVRSAGEATLNDGTEYRETYYYAPNVGLIEGIIPVAISPGNIRRYRLTLRGYTPDGEY